MINCSLSTVLMTVLTSDLLIIVVSLCFRYEKALFSIGYKLLTVLLTLALIRFIFPIELPFTKTIPLPEALSVIIYYIHYAFFKVGELRVSFWTLLECIWVCGIAYNLGKLIHVHATFSNFIRKYGVNVTSKEPYFSALSKVCDSHKMNPRIIMISGIDTPCQKGVFRPDILIPIGMNLAEKDLHFTIIHELIHYKHRDFLIKLGVNILNAVYWWNPLCYVLRDQMDVLIEMRVDDKVVKGDEKVRFAYLETLLHIGNIVTNCKRKKNGPSYLLPPKAVGGMTDLRRRARMMYRKKKSAILASLGLLVLAAVLFVGSYCVIFEAYYVPVEDVLETPEIMADEMHAVILEDGSYQIYLGDVPIEHVESLKYYPDVQIEK